MLCNYLQNVAAITYIFVLQLSTFLFYNKQSEGHSPSVEGLTAYRYDSTHDVNYSSQGHCMQ